MTRWSSWIPSARATRTATGAGNVLAIGWSGDTVVAARIGGLEPAAHVRIERIDPASERVEVGDALADEGIEWVIAGNDSISPDRTHATSRADRRFRARLQLRVGLLPDRCHAGAASSRPPAARRVHAWTDDGQAILSWITTLHRRP